MRNALQDAGIRAAADRLHQRARHFDAGGRPHRNAWPSSACFGEHAYKVAVSSTKSMTGHLLGGAGGLEAGITVLAIRDQIAPPTINYETSRSGVRPGLRSQPRAADEDRLRAVEFVRLRRHQRLPDFQAIHRESKFTMKIIVAIKQVPVRDSPLRVDAAGQLDQEADLSFEINEPDAYALEEALQLKEKHGGEVVVLCAGPARAAQTIREALAKGADRAIHIEEENLRRARHAGRRAAAGRGASQPEKPDLILTGLQSDDLGYGQTGVILAELLGLPHSTIIMQVEVRTAAIRVKRELEDGWFQHVEMPLPAVLTIQTGINKLRYATLMGIKKAKTKEIKRVTPAELGGRAAAASIDRASLPAAEEPSRRRSSKATPKEAAAQAGRETEVRGAGHMSILVVLEQRGGAWHRMSWETLAAASSSARSWAAGRSGGGGQRHRRAGERAGGQEARRRSTPSSTTC